MRFRLLRRLFSRKHRDKRPGKSCAPALRPSPLSSTRPTTPAPTPSPAPPVPASSGLLKKPSSSALDQSPPPAQEPSEIVTTRTTSSPSRSLTSSPLPFELQVVVLRHLDVNADRKTFLALLHLSSWWEAAAKTLYRNIDLSGDKLCHLLGDDPATLPPPITKDVRSPYAHNEIRLLAGIIRIIAVDNPSLASRLQAVLNDEVATIQTKQETESLHSTNLSPRMRLALSFIKRMNIHSLHSRLIRRMIAVHIPHVVLFPNVETLHIYEADDDPVVEADSSDCEDLPRIDSTMHGFDSPDFCVWGYLPLPYLRHMQIKSIKNATWHTKTVMKVLEEYWFYTFRDTLGNHSLPRFFAEGFSYGDSLPFYNPDQRAGGLPLRFWVGASSFHHPEHACPTEIPTGEWDESVADAHQFRTDGPEYKHPPCTVCGTKIDQDTRVFDCVFTKA